MATSNDTFAKDLFETFIRENGRGLSVLLEVEKKNIARQSRAHVRPDGRARGASQISDSVANNAHRSDDTVFAIGYAVSIVYMRNRTDFRSSAKTIPLTKEEQIAFEPERYEFFNNPKFCYVIANAEDRWWTGFYSIDELKKSNVSEERTTKALEKSSRIPLESVHKVDVENMVFWALEKQGPVGDPLFTK